MADGALPPWTSHSGHEHQHDHDDTSSVTAFGFGGPPTTAEEEDICRVCRESTPGVPLLHPCKCSGSIKYVHQECLLQWIKTKQIAKCELCKYPFKLSKLYDPRMPSQVPHRLFLRRIIVQLQNNMLTYLRFLLVCFIWLGLVPLLARWIWRFYFRFGAYSLIPPEPAIAPETNATTPALAERKAGVWGEGVFGWLGGEDVWSGILRDCFQGQIITICLVAVFVVVFLIREWVMQNALEVLEEPAVEGLVDEDRQVDVLGEEIEEDDGRDEGWYDDRRDEPIMEYQDQNPDFFHHRWHDEAPPAPQPVFAPQPAFALQPAFAPQPVFAPPPVVPPVRNQVVVNFDDDGDLDEDDFNGLWDILGMQGPIIGLLHNTVFSALMIALAVGLGVWLPFMFGKTVLGAIAHPLDILVQHPLTMIRMSVDICLDILLFVLGGTLFSIHSLTHHLLHYTAPLLPLAQKATTYLDARAYGTTYLHLAQTSGSRILQAFNSSTSSQDALQGFPTLLDSPYFAFLKDHFPHLTDMSSFKGTITEKVVAVMAGYLIFTCLGAIYLRVRKLHAPQPGEDNTERLIRDILRQAGAILKVVVIITIEFIFFPIFCGILIDLATLPLFPAASIASRLQFGRTFGFTATFLHWFAGTLYMFHFAMFVSMCRDLVRAGTLYFIRDPNDPHFHPIREILERPTLHQLRKIGVSACIYAMLIMSGFAVTIKAISLAGAVLPLRISSLEPVFEVPVDLLMSHIALPLTAHFVKPSATLKAAWKWWFEITARTLRLSSFLFGVRVDDEEGSIPVQRIVQFKRRPRKEELQDGDFRGDGAFLRVPATDAIPLNQRKQMLIPVTEDNRRLDGVEESEDARGDEDFRVVYVPPHFSTRICILFLWMWAYSVLLGLSVTLVPLLLGRRLFTVVFGASTKMHDIYAYGLGLYTLIATILFVEFAADKLSQLRAANDAATLKRDLIAGAVRLGKWLYLIVFGCVLLPLLAGMCLDLYVMLPFRRWFAPDAKVEMQILQNWAFGVIHLKIAGRIILYLDGRPAQNLRNIFPGHWTNPNIHLATRKFLIPLFKLGLAALLTPLLLTFLIIHARTHFHGPLDIPPETLTLAYLHMYPLFMGIVCMVTSALLGKRALDKWRDSVRDEIYLVGEVLHNLDENEQRVDT